MLPVISTGSTEFVEDDRSLVVRSLFVPQENSFDIFFFRSWTHNQLSFEAPLSGNIHYESTIPF